MKATFYRLGEHKIIQAGGAIWWEAHAGVGAFQSGRCFIRGSILLLGPSEKEEPGYLKREFLQSLQNLQQWDHTKYYCSNFSVQECRSGRRLTEEELSEWAGIRTPAVEHADSMNHSPTGRPDPAAGISYRLGQHEVTKKSDSHWWWKAYSGSGGLREGRCVVEGGILFLGAAEKKEESGDQKLAFLERLSQLPQWRATGCYCPSCAIYDCRTGKNLIGQEANQLPSESPRIRTVDVFIPSAKVLGLSTPLSIPKLSSSIDSTLSLLKKLAGKAGRTVYRKVDEAILKYKLCRKSRNISLDKAAPEVTIHRFPVRKWMGWVGAFIRVAGLLLLALFHDLWNAWERYHHRNHDYSTGRHRDH